MYEMEDIFTPVSNFIIAHIAFVAAVSIRFFCNVTSLGIVCIGNVKPQKFVFSTFHAHCKLLMGHSVGHLAKITLGHPCTSIEPAQCCDFSQSFHFFLFEHYTGICLNCDAWVIMTCPWGAGFWDRSNSPIRQMLLLYPAGKQNSAMSHRSSSRAPRSPLKFTLHWSLCDWNQRAGVTQFHLYHQTANTQEKGETDFKLRILSLCP